MRIVIQRVLEAAVSINGAVYSQIGRGYLLLVGFEDGDNESILPEMARKVVELRICDDENGKMNLPLSSIAGEILSVSQFTLYADCRKGRRPSFIRAAVPEKATVLYDAFNRELEKYGVTVRTGIFQAEMKVSLINDGPVTIILDSDEIIKTGGK